MDLSGTRPVIPYIAVSWFSLSLGSSFMALMHSLNELTKSFQLACEASVRAMWPPGGLCKLDIVHLLFFHMSSATAMAFTVFDVNEKIGEALLLQIMMSLSDLNASLICF